MSRRRLRRKAEAQRHAPPPRPNGVPAVPPFRSGPLPVVQVANRVQRLAYTRTQAAGALGISRSTLRRVLPYVETIELPWGATLIPVDELERLIAERRQPAGKRRQPTTAGRPAALAADVVERICTERAAGKTLHQIARDLNADGTPTAHGGARWWASTVRGVLQRASSSLEVSQIVLQCVALQRGGEMPERSRTETVSRSFRFTSSLVETLQERARERGESANALAERLIDEGLRREEHPLIDFRDGAAGRRAAIIGTRLGVSQVIDTLRASSNSVAETAAYFGIPEPWVQAAVRYYAAYPNEVESFADRVKATAEREHDLWERQQAVLG